MHKQIKFEVVTGFLIRFSSDSHDPLLFLWGEGVGHESPFFQTTSREPYDAAKRHWTVLTGETSVVES